MRGVAATLHLRMNLGDSCHRPGIVRARLLLGRTLSSAAHSLALSYMQGVSEVSYCKFCCGVKKSVSNQHFHKFNHFQYLFIFFCTLKFGFHTTMVGAWEVLPETGFCLAGAARRRCLSLQKSSCLLNLLRQSLSFAQFQDCPNIYTPRERPGFARSLREIKMSTCDTKISLFVPRLRCAIAEASALQDIDRSKLVANTISVVHPEIQL